MKIFETWNDFSKDQKRVWKRKVSSQLLLQEELFHTFFQLYQGTQSRQQRDFVDKAGERLAARLDIDRETQVCCIEL